MADMGFLPQVEWLLRRTPGRKQTLLFSATLDGAVDTLIQRYQHDPVHHEVVSETMTVDEMEHRFLLVHQMDKVKVAAAIGRQRRAHAGVRPTPSGAPTGSPSTCGDEGVRAEAIHGDLRQKAARAGAWPTSSRASCRCSSPPTSPPAASTSTTSTWSSTTTRPRTTRPTCTAPAARPAAGESGVVVTLVLWNQELEVKRLQKRLGVDAADRRDLLERPPPRRPGGLGPRPRAGDELEPILDGQRRGNRDAHRRERLRARSRSARRAVAARTPGCAPAQDRRTRRCGCWRRTRTRCRRAG